MQNIILSHKKVVGELGIHQRDHVADRLKTKGIGASIANNFPEKFEDRIKGIELP